MHSSTTSSTWSCTPSFFSHLGRLFDGKSCCSFRRQKKEEKESKNTSRRRNTKRKKKERKEKKGRKKRTKGKRKTTKGKRKRTKGKIQEQRKKEKEVGITLLVGLLRAVYSQALSHYWSMRRLLPAACSALGRYVPHHQPGRAGLPPRHHVDTELSVDAWST